MGSKSTSKAIMIDAGVPVTPGCEAESRRTSLPSRSAPSVIPLSLSLSLWTMNNRCVTRYHGDDQSVERLLDEAKRIQFPVLIKATLGGGGKGMRLVEKEEDFVAALDACRSPRGAHE